MNRPSSSKSGTQISKKDKSGDDAKKQNKVISPFKKGKQQWADHLTQKAKHDSYPARSVYKLMEIQKKFNIMKKGDIVLDLGCAPGSWLLFAAQTVGSKGIAVGVDLQKVEIRLPSNAIAIQGDIFCVNQDSFNFLGYNSGNAVLDLNNNAANLNESVDSDIIQSNEGTLINDASNLNESVDLNIIESNEGTLINDASNLNESVDLNIIESNEGTLINDAANLNESVVLNIIESNIVKQYDVVLSDMAPSTTGRKDVDSARSFELCEAALRVASDWLSIGGNFVCKVFQGAEFKAFEQGLKVKFRQLAIFKPESCRKASKEIYIIGKGKI